MSLRAAWSLALILVLTCAGSAQDEAGRHEFSLSLGYAHPFEDDAFKTRAPVRVPGGLALDLTYLYAIEPGIGVGLSISGYAARTGRVPLTDPFGNPLDEAFTITPVSFSLLGSLRAERGLVRPFVFVAGGVCVGGITESALGELRLLGFSYAFGGGFRIPIENGIAVKVHAVASGARATWKEKPFADSASDRYDAGFVGVLAGVAVTLDEVWNRGSE